MADFCLDPQGWGPVSPVRYAFTPCFQDGILAAIPPLFLILAGSAQAYNFSQSARPPGHTRTWQYWTKLAVAAVLTGLNVVLALIRFRESEEWQRDVLYWSAVLKVLAGSLAFTLHHLEHIRNASPVPSGVLLFYWLWTLIVDVIKEYDMIDGVEYTDRLVYFIVFSVGLGGEGLIFVLEWLVPKGGRDDYRMLLVDEDDDGAEPCPADYADIFSSWMTPLMKYGHNVFLKESDLWGLRKRDRSSILGSTFSHEWERQLSKKRPSVTWAIAHAYGKTYAIAAIFKMCQDILAFVQPQLLRRLLAFVNNFDMETSSPVKGFAIALTMFLVSVTQTSFLHQYFQRCFEFGMRTKSGLTASIYKKSLSLSNDGRHAKSTGDVVNLMSVDTQRLHDVSQYAQIVWSAPFQITLCLISLYNLVGPSMLAGLGIMIIMIPINGIISRIMKKYQRQQMKNKDARTRLINEILTNIKSIKLYAWEPAFMKRLRHVRNDLELHTLRKMGAMSALSNMTWTTAPFLVSCSTFAIFVLTMDQPLTTEIVWPALALFNLLAFPLAVLPSVITGLVEASVSVSRLNEFLQASELQPNAVRREPPVQYLDEETVHIQAGTFKWSSSPTAPIILHNIDFSARKGELSCLVGRVGAGKSSFISALLGDMFKVQGDVVTRGKVAYVAQTPWIMNGSVKENILFGHRFDPDFYERTVEACAMADDFKALPDGDNTEVGEKGISLSGGQKARLALARAVYARADIYFLDDPLSAVDAHVGRHLIDNVLGPQGLLKTKTRVLATNAIGVLSQADAITMIRAGRIVENGSYESVMNAKLNLYNLIMEFGKRADEGDNVKTDAEDTDTSSLTLVNREEVEGGDSAVTSDQDNDMIENEPMKPSLTRGIPTRRASVASFHRGRGKKNDEERARLTEQKEEHMEQGRVQWDVYVQYAKACSYFGIAAHLILIVGSQTAQVGGNLWLKRWSESNELGGENSEFIRFISVYFLLGLSTAILVACSAIVLYLVCCLRGSKKLHDDMAQAVLRSPMQFFETTPVGRILNRFSNDIYKIDEVIPRTFSMFFRNTVQVAFVMVVISTSTPAFVVLILPFAGIYYYIQRYYLATSRELKRLESITRSPVYSHFQESLGGISTIRAYEQMDRFMRENEWRIDINTRAYFPLISANRWLAVRLEFIGSLIIFSAASLSIVSLFTTGISAGLVGLAMSYALQTTQALNWIVRQTVEVETNIVSVERVLEYSRLPSEAPEIVRNHRPDSKWPSRGGVSFNNYSTRYRDGLPLVLKNITFQVKPREKVGIVGRTGAGKSSLTLALFRIIEPSSGYITIDGLNTSHIGLYDLRTRLAIIPQDAQVFEGTMRSNLDPSGIHDDVELWKALELAHLKDHVTSMEGQLSAKITEGGSNLSSGQRSLMCLARALLTPSRILVLDEATASVDVETDKVLQETIRTEFADRTILTIAHRINTIMDSDRILLLSAGKVVEFDAPENLLQNKDSLFYGLVRESGLLPTSASATPGGTATPS